MDTVNVLFIGDIIGKPGMEFLEEWLPKMKEKYKPDVIIANGENASDGKGITVKETTVMFRLGVNVITGGNHIWDKHGIQEYIKTEPRLLRPLNYPRGTHGEGYYIHESEKCKVAVVNLQGRAFMNPIDCPFRGSEPVVAKLRKETCVIIVDVHAEASAEKMALGYWLDGKVSAVLGTHTHVQTNDERILPNGTGYITDVGMTGPYDSVIGMKTQAAINRFVYQTPQKYECGHKDMHLAGIRLKIEIESGKTIEIERIFFPDFIKQV